jgi:hypothetical protein
VASGRVDVRTVRGRGNSTSTAATHRSTMISGRSARRRAASRRRPGERAGEPGGERRQAAPPGEPPARAKRRVAAPEPNTDWPLLVPSASGAGTPAVSNAGSVNRPPPPAIASMQPATAATAVSATVVAEADDPPRHSTAACAPTRVRCRRCPRDELPPPSPRLVAAYDAERFRADGHQ